MNLLTIIIYASTVIYSMATTINNYNISTTQYIIKKNISNFHTLAPDKENGLAENIANFKKCYKIDKWLNLLKAKNIIDEIKNYTSHAEIQRCQHHDDICFFSILWSSSVPSIENPDSIFSRCGEKKDLIKENQHNLNKHFLDYDSNDIERTFWVDDFCESNLCNSFDLKNLPLAKKVLSTVVKDAAHHEVFCPGYADNHQRINIHAGYQDINVPEGSNLLLFAGGSVSVYEKYEDDLVFPYNSTKWSFSPLEKYHNDSSLTLVSISKNGNVTKHDDVDHDLINKIFYYNVLSIHICNFTKEDEGIFKHVDILNNKANLVYAVNITTREAEKHTLSSVYTLTPRTISLVKTTMLPTQMITASTQIKIFKTNITPAIANKIKKGNSATYIVIGVIIPLGVVFTAIVTYIAYKKRIKNNHPLLENENEVIGLANFIESSV